MPHYYVEMSINFALTVDAKDRDEAVAIALASGYNEAEWETPAEIETINGIPYDDTSEKD